MLANLKGIQNGKDVQVRENSVLERLLEIEEEVRKEYAPNIKPYSDSSDGYVYLPLYEKLYNSLPEYSEDDIQSLLFAKADNNYSDEEAQVLGMYTGVLLHVLTERYEKEGKNAIFEFDLQEQEFDYLFFFAKRAGEVTIRNVNGDGTCCNIASYGGQAKKIVIENNEGNHTASCAGNFNGKIETLVINGNKGDKAASRAGGYGGTIETLVINRNEGDHVAMLTGSEKGNIKILIINLNEGNNVARWAGSFNGNLETLALCDIERNTEVFAKAQKTIFGKKALQFYQQLQEKIPCLRT